MQTPQHPRIASLVASLLLLTSAVAWPNLRADAPPATSPTPSGEAQGGGDDAGDDDGVKLHIGEGERRSARDNKSLFEITIGTAQGFPAKLVGDYEDDTEIIATSSVVVLLEVFIQRWVRASFYYDLIITPEVRSVNGEFVEEIIPSRILFGAVWVPFYIDFSTSARIEFQGLTQLGLTIDDSPVFVPSLAGRIALMQDYAEGVTTYIGVFYHFNIDKVGLLYGVGYRF